MEMFLWNRVFYKWANAINNYERAVIGYKEYEGVLKEDGI